MDHGGAHVLIHWAAAVVLVIGGAAAVALSAVARRRPRPIAPGVPASPPELPLSSAGSAPVERSTAWILAILSLGAAAIHLAAAPSHYVELGDLGAGFLVAAAFQAAWARSILGGANDRTLVIGGAINAAIVAAWVVSRTWGLPVGPAPGLPEPIGLPDGASTAFELLLLAGLAIRAFDLDRLVAARVRVTRTVLAIAVVPVLGLVILTAALASLAIVAGADHGVAPGAGHGGTMSSSSGH
jgi:hypothetical protein